jgi:hypothetical protein
MMKMFAQISPMIAMVGTSLAPAAGEVSGVSTLIVLFMRRDTKKREPAGIVAMPF